MPSGGFEPPTNGLCLPSTFFNARYRFVVWTFSSLYEFAVKSLHFPRLCRRRLSSGLSYPSINLDFPEFNKFYQYAVNNKLATHFSNLSRLYFHSVSQIILGLLAFFPDLKHKPKKLQKLSSLATSNGTQSHINQDEKKSL